MLTDSEKHALREIYSKPRRKRIIAPKDISALVAKGYLYYECGDTDHYMTDSRCVGFWESDAECVALQNSRKEADRDLRQQFGF